MARRVGAAAGTRRAARAPDPMLVLAALWVFSGVGGMGSAKGAAAPQHLTRRVGDSATLSLEASQVSGISNLVWRSSSKGSMHVVADWEPGDAADILNENYVGRVTFHEESWSLEIRNLSKADGGVYRVVELQEPSERLLQEYTLVVFDFSVEDSHAVNGSCKLSLRCEAGAGAGAKVMYSWSPRGDPEAQDSVLRFTLRRGEKRKLYTCTATTLGAQHAVTILPDKYCPPGSGAAGLLAPTSFTKASLLALLLLLLLL